MRTRRRRESASSTVASLSMAYSTNYVRPRSPPVKVPLVRLTIRHPIDRGAGVTLASGGEFSGHARFLNAWNQPALTRLVEACFHDRPCNDPRRR